MILTLKPFCHKPFELVVDFTHTSTENRFRVWIFFSFLVFLQICKIWNVIIFITTRAGFPSVCSSLSTVCWFYNSLIPSKDQKAKYHIVEYILKNFLWYVIIIVLKKQKFMNCTFIFTLKISKNIFEECTIKKISEKYPFENKKINFLLKNVS